MFRSSTIIRELVLSLAKVMLIHLCSLSYVVVWQHVLGVACVLCAVQNETVCGGVAACLGSGVCVWIFFENMSGKFKFRLEHQNTLCMFNNAFFSRISGRLWDSVEKCGTAGQTTDDNIIRRTRIFIKDYQDYRHTHRVRNTYGFFTATVITPKPLNITL
jgi:hypothetical protein